MREGETFQKQKIPAKRAQSGKQTAKKQANQRKQLLLLKMWICFIRENVKRIKLFLDLESAIDLPAPSKQKKEGTSFLMHLLLILRSLRCPYTMFINCRIGI